MSIRVYDTVSGSTLIFPALPEKINFSAATKFFEYELINTGDVKVPMGEELSKISFSGILPGEKKKNAPYVSNWKNPREIQSIWSVWRTAGRKLRLTIDGTPINHGVYLESYDVEYAGGFGDYAYSIEFVIAKEIIVNIEPKPEPDVNIEDTSSKEENEKRWVTVTGNRVNVRKGPSTSYKVVFIARKGAKYEYAGKTEGNWHNIIANGENRWISSKYSKLSAGTSSSSSGSSGSKTYTVKYGDSLWRIAKNHYGNGNKYKDIKKANNLTRNTIYVGQTLILP